jgi:magnesium chelatase family protein
MLRVEYEKFSDERLGEPSAAVRERVEKARDRQRVRFEALRRQESSQSGITSNADMLPAEARKYCVLDDTGRTLMQTATSQL